MKISSKLLTVLVLMLALASCAPKNGELTKAQMREDVAYFFTSFLETHPNPYCRATPKQVDSIKTALLQKIDKGLTKEEFLNELGKLNGLLDGHSYIASPLLELTDKDTCFLPPIVQINSDLTLSINNKLLPKENTIVSINGIPSWKLLSMFGKMLNSDPNVVKRTAIEPNFPTLLARSGILSPYTIKVRTCQGDTSMNVKGSQPVTYSREIRSLQGQLNGVGLNSSIYQKSKLAILYFNTCSTNDEAKYKKTIDDFFAAIQKSGIKYLFIDNSRNDGGSSKWGVYLISKINHIKYQPSFYARIKESKASKTINIKESIGLLRNTVPAVTNGFNGKVYMLLSRHCFSAGSDAAWYFRFAKVGKIFGEKSGSSNPMYVCSAEFTFPNCKLNFRLSVREGGYISFQDKKMVFLKEPEPDVPFNINPFKTSYTEQELLALLRLADK